MEKRSAEETALARIEEIKKEYYLRLDSVDLSFASLKEHQPAVRDYFSDFSEKNVVSQELKTTVLAVENLDLLKNVREEEAIEPLEPKENQAELSFGQGIIEKFLAEPATRDKQSQKEFFIEIKSDFSKEAEETKPPVKDVKEEKEKLSLPKETVLKKELAPQKTSELKKESDLPSNILPKHEVDYFPDSPDESAKIASEGGHQEDIPSLLKEETVGKEKPVLERVEPSPLNSSSERPRFPDIEREGRIDSGKENKDYFPDERLAFSASLKEAVSSRFKKNYLGERVFSFYPLLVIGALVMSGVALGIWEKYSSWEKALSFSDPVGLVPEGDHLLSLDAPDKLLYTLKSSSGRVIKKENFVCDHASGLAGFQNEFWCSEADKGDVRRYFLINGNEYELQRVYQTFGAKIGALYSDGNYLWAADAASGQIFQYLIVKALTGILLTPIDRFTVSDISPAGLYASHGILWILDAKNRQIKRFKISVSKADPIDFYDLKDKIKAVGELTGLSVIEGKVWVLTRHPSKIFNFNLKDLPHHSLTVSSLTQNGANAR